MAFENMTSSVNAAINNLSLSQAIEALQPLVLFVIGITLYSVFIFKFYKFISRKDIFRISKGGDHSILKKIAYLLEYIFLFPVIAFSWFLVISTFLSIVSELVSMSNIFLISMATMASIRIAAYYDEDLSKDLAKLIPFAFLAILLTDLVEISSDIVVMLLNQLPDVLGNIIYYFIFIVVLEFILRLVFHGKPRLTRETMQAPIS